MKKSIIFIILGLFVFSIFLNIINISPVGADSGFDSSYDSGGSWDSDSSWDSGSSWDSDSSNGGGPSDPRDGGVILLSICAVVAYYLLAAKVFKFKDMLKLPIWYRIIYKSLIFLIIYLLFKLDYFIFSLVFYIIIRIAMIGISKKVKGITKPREAKIIDGIDNEKIVNDAFKNYKELQIAWMNFDYDKIKELVSDEMYNMYTNQLETLKIKNQQNVMSDIEFIEGYITDYKKVNNKETIKVYMSVSCYDYIINAKNNMTVRGNKNRKLTLSYILTFERSVEIVNHCPQCGADVENLTECNYCKSKIVNNHDKLKMTKKQIISQK